MGVSDHWLDSSDLHKLISQLEFGGPMVLNIVTNTRMTKVRGNNRATEVRGMDSGPKLCTMDLKMCLSKKLFGMGGGGGGGLI